MPQYYCIGENEATTWAVGCYPTVQQAADTHNIAPWRLKEGTSEASAWKEWGHIQKYARMAVADDKRYVAQQAGRAGGSAGVGVAKIRANFAESLRKARAVRSARILAKRGAEQRNQCPMCNGIGSTHISSFDRTIICECCNGSGMADA